MKLGVLKSPALAWTVVVVASLFIALAVLNIFIQPTFPLSSVPLLVLMPLSLSVGIASLREQRRGRS